MFAIDRGCSWLLINLSFSSLDYYTHVGYSSRDARRSQRFCTKRLNRIEGQVRGLSRMVEEGRYCIDIKCAPHCGG